MKKDYKDFQDTQSLSAENLNYLESLEYDKNDLVEKLNLEKVHSDFTSLSKDDVLKTFSNDDKVSSSHLEVKDDILSAVQSIGYRFADTNPLDPRVTPPEISDFNQFGYNLKGKIPTTYLSQYCGKLAIDHSFLIDVAKVNWLNSQIESNISLEINKKINILNDLLRAELFEKNLSVKYVGQKRFGIEGLESLIPCLNTLLESYSKNGVQSVTIGMAHRGRLNVMTNICGMSTKTIYDMFTGVHNKTKNTSGDVKYHLGYDSHLLINNDSIHVSLACNPSHLEFIYPVVMGEVKANAKKMNSKAVVIHGDSAVSGQGIVMESLNMSETYAYGIGGTVHIVLDNNIGFTTLKDQTRSSFGCADIAKFVQAPIIYANADCPESVYKATIIASNYIDKFNKDIFIVIIGYRRLGHNESDEPSMTQPQIYKFIKSHPTAIEIYKNKLIKEGVLTQGDFNDSVNRIKSKLRSGEIISPYKVTEYHAQYVHLDNFNWEEAYDSKVSGEILKELGQKISLIPDSIQPHRSIQNVYKQRQLMIDGQRSLDWGMAEMLAYASLLKEGFSLRLTGQDVERGTFSHRHAYVHCELTGNSYPVLKAISSNVNIHNSTLSEQAVLGFEYGYSIQTENELVIWEAQFGDFANGAQVIIDQFITSGEQKWDQASNLVLLLPHGHEGMGPEHTSARIERFLQLSGQQNIQVCVPTMPSQIFHLLRRQLKRNYKKPLIVFTPKSLLRLPAASSKLEELSHGEFQLIIGDHEKFNDTDRLIICYGKVYYDLLQYRDENKLNTAIIRIEQLYPFPKSKFQDILKKYTKVDKFIWCQEEHKNQGGWYRLQEKFNSCLPSGKTLMYTGRQPAASPAAGYYAKHLEEQMQLVKDAFEV